MTITPNLDHPAKFSPPILDAIRAVVAQVGAGGPYLTGPTKVLDPFAGVGLIHTLDDLADVETWGVELEPEWAACHPRTIVADSRRLPFPDAQFDIVASSPSYGNRMADHHDAADPCSTCAGSGCVVPGCTGGDSIADYHRSTVPAPVDEHRPCPKCKGTGLSRRNTYRHRLGRPLSPGSGSSMHFTTDAYKRLHLAVLADSHRVLSRYGLLVWNVSNHESGGVEHRVVEWYLDQLLHQTGPRGWPLWRLEALHPVATRRNRFGANADRRVDQEFVLVLRKV